MRIVAATDFSTRSNRALRQAGLLAQNVGAELDIVHVVDDDRPKRMLDMEKREAERILAEQIEAMEELRGVWCQPMVVVGDPFDGILRSTTAIKPELIVMGQHRRQLLRDILVGTTIERVVRAGAFPVLMVNNEAQCRYQRVVVAVDMSETSAQAIIAARSVGLFEVQPTLLHAFDAPAKGKMMIGGAQRSAIAEHVERERQRARTALTAFLAAHGLRDEPWPIVLEEGNPNEVISRTVRERQADLLVVGTRGRSKLLNMLIGGVAEECLRSLVVDVLAVPPRSEQAGWGQRPSA